MAVKAPDALNVDDAPVESRVASVAARLSEAFMAHLAAQARAAVADPASLDETLETLVAAAEASWPELAVPRGAFLAYIAKRVPGDAPPEDALLRLSLDELYLVCAYNHGQAEAVRAIERDYMRRIESGLCRAGASQPMIQDIKQTLYQRLISDNGRAEFSGRGRLLGWLYVTAMGEARDTWRKDERLLVVPNDELLDLATEEDEEMTYIRSHYRQEFKEAFAGAIASLSTRERNVLRYHLLDGLGIDEIGGLYRVHRATVARWIAKARHELMVQTQRGLFARIRGGPAELSSILRLVRSQLDVSVRRLLGGVEQDAGR